MACNFVGFILGSLELLGDIVFGFQTALWYESYFLLNLGVSEISKNVLGLNGSRFFWIKRMA